jgi:hypothetical protein
MQTKDYLENITEYSDAVQVTVRGYDGSIRVFNLDNAKVVLRYIDIGRRQEHYAYHPENIKTSGQFRSGEGAWLELVVMTDDAVTLEAEM